jgi:hypothetical protein
MHDTVKNHHNQDDVHGRAIDITVCWWHPRFLWFLEHWHHWTPATGHCKSSVTLGSGERIFLFYS